MCWANSDSICDDTHATSTGRKAWLYSVEHRQTLQGFCVCEVRLRILLTAKMTHWLMPNSGNMSSAHFWICMQVERCSCSQLPYCTCTHSVFTNVGSHAVYETNSMVTATTARCLPEVGEPDQQQHQQSCGGWLLHGVCGLDRHAVLCPQHAAALS